MNESASQRRHDRIIALWLFACCALVFAMVVLGGVTRLTGSGLSMVEWDPIFGIVPPLSQEAWQTVFEKYQASPEYKKKNFGMDLDGFKEIYWFEYAHRVLGRTIGSAFLLPFLFFLWRGWIRRPLVPKLVAMFVLGGLQGLLGWYMVKSGLVDDPHVSQYRLTAHLLLAFLIYGFILWVALDLWRGDRVAPHPRWRPAATLTALTFVTIGSGGLVAGLKAGHAYNTFPLMDGRLVPEVWLMLEPAWRNFFENIATVQFDHRLLAITTLTLTLLFAWRAATDASLPAASRRALLLWGGMAIVQVMLGIGTLLLHVPIALASSHQAGALVLLTLALNAVHRLRRPAPAHSAG
ncbi:COX15/CtaA family protein [Thiohalobacter sp.]|uniref:COX15/CtaA family protein n=1 Tax=Thiohalobacter sp. TaxID=2025948 RepID=UPI0026027924|nr:COX15/CtaA family protein [Thiohalobacter sp.]